VEGRGHPLGRPLTPSSTSARVRDLIIAIDGPAASGKSTTAKLVAERLGYTYIDSGAMYRAAALKALRLGVPMDDHAALGLVAACASIELDGGGRGPVLLDGEDVTEAIRAPEVTEASSTMSTVPAVRRALVEEQRRIGRSTDCVMEGRDIGTVVFPGADLKVFLVASLAERARRRFDELKARGEAVDLADVAADIAERDRRDSTRTDSPLVRAGDAVEVDTTNLTIEEQVARVLALAVERGAELGGTVEQAGGE
jgi:cytidylate kinase